MQWNYPHSLSRAYFLFAHISDYIFGVRLSINTTLFYAIVHITFANCLMTSLLILFILLQHSDSFQTKKILALFYVLWFENKFTFRVKSAR